MAGDHVKVIRHSERAGISWLWSEVYRGIELRLLGRALWMGWTHPAFKARGW